MSCNITVSLKESLIHSQGYGMLKARVHLVALFFDGMEPSAVGPI